MRHVKDSSTNLTSWTSLTAGRPFFFVDVPVFFEGSFPRNYYSWNGFLLRL